MKKVIFLLFVGLILLMTGCSNTTEKKEIGQGELKLVTSEISEDDNKLEFMTNDIDESKPVFISVANKVVFEGKIKNDDVYPLDISNVKDSHRTDYNPKVQLFQTKNDREDGDMVTFKQVRYKVIK